MTSVIQTEKLTKFYGSHQVVIESRALNGFRVQHGYMHMRSERVEVFAADHDAVSEASERPPALDVHHVGLRGHEPPQHRGEGLGVDHHAGALGVAEVGRSPMRNPLGGHGQHLTGGQGSSVHRELASHSGRVTHPAPRTPPMGRGAEISPILDSPVADQPPGGGVDGRVELPDANREIARE